MYFVRASSEWYLLILQDLLKIFSRNLQISQISLIVYKLQAEILMSYFMIILFHFSNLIQFE